ncbi:hypothetical protein [Sphingomonas panaciterrae]|uniref:hypothetical protein n=1 Tax=Sphingomonas panaciterrae TaxID=1462999 RepID=UPI002FF08F27
MAKPYIGRSWLHVKWSDEEREVIVRLMHYLSKKLELYCVVLGMDLGYKYGMPEFFDAAEEATRAIIEIGEEKREFIFEEFAKKHFYVNDSAILRLSRWRR